MALVPMLILTGCSGEKKTNADAPKNEKKFEAATDLQGMLREGPGKYAGDKYDKAKVEKELDKLPNNLTGKEAYNQLIRLLAQDYKSVVEKMNKIDLSNNVDENEPGTKIKELPKERPVNVTILFDSSGSMAGKVPGGVKMDLAKQAIQDFAEKIPKNANVSLRVYGHKGTNSKVDKAESCKSTEEVYPMGPYDAQKFDNALNQFKPGGWTPLASSIKAAKEDLMRSDQEGKAQNIVYVVSDGVETCDGDPVAAAQQLHDSHIKAVVNIIGFDVDNAGQQALQQVANTGGGTYATVQSKADLEEYLKKEYERLKDEWESWAYRATHKAGEEWAHDYEQIADQTISGILGKNNDEHTRLLNALWYLNEHNKLKGGEYGEGYDKLDALIDRRFELISNYSDKQYDKLTKIAEENQKQAEQEIEERKNEGISNIGQ
ncbi:hypothetical protein GCM10011571_04470 [Marinithermofilum abyssi]|uniref:VWFA domain-containing protein n=1 Tax=Marinithermofilum abyssi TaxID=1571185 RepID=A0A8J2VCF5_9BACL|nr:hypothetical protein GCM10011571_04470 [Marinithermofilum abyssi]